MKYRDFFEGDMSEMAYPVDWNIETFKSLKSFSKRVEYCNRTLKRIASGSSRIAYVVDDEKVLKLAKNKKGIAQNGVERDWYIQQAYTDIVAKVFDVEQNDLWLEMELAKKVSPARFKSIVGVNVEEVGTYLLSRDAENNGRRTSIRISDPELKSVLDNNEWVQRVSTLCQEVDLSPGDFGRASSYGEVDRDGKPAIVIIDLGLSKSAANDFYGIN